jgi:hypothetical protein
MNDLKFAFRQLLKNPGFTTVAVLSLALGIAANTTIFSFVNVLLLRPPPSKPRKNYGRYGGRTLRAVPPSSVTRG